MNREELNTIIKSNTEADWQGKNIIEAVSKYAIDVYNKAIDDFTEEIRKFVQNNGTIPNYFNVDKMAEQLKEGEKNEKKY